MKWAHFGRGARRVEAGSRDRAWVNAQSPLQHGGLDPAGPLETQSQRWFSPRAASSSDHPGPALCIHEAAGSSPISRQFGWDSVRCPRENRGVQRPGLELRPGAGLGASTSSSSLPALVCGLTTQLRKGKFLGLKSSG